MKKVVVSNFCPLFLLPTHFSTINDGQFLEPIFGADMFK